MSNKKERKGLDIMGMFGATNTEAETDTQQTKQTEQEAVDAPEQAVKIREHQPQQSPAKDERTYKAFSSNKAGQAQLEIRLKGNRGRWLYYPMITPAEYERDELITLICHQTAYIIRGRNFKALKNHFRTQTIEYMQEFDPKQFDALPEAGEAFIEEIEIVEVEDGEEE